MDRDGVLNEPVVLAGKPYPPGNAAQLVIQPGTATACARLHTSALLIVVTNQPDIARGLQTRATVDDIHAALRRQLELDAIYLCPHDDGDDCPCRKPRPGMLLEAAREYDIDLGRSVMVGDRWRDIEAGRRAGCATVWVNRGYDEAPADGAELTVEAFPQAVAWILERVKSTAGGS